MAAAIGGEGDGAGAQAKGEEAAERVLSALSRERRREGAIRGRAGCPYTGSHAASAAWREEGADRWAPPVSDPEERKMKNVFSPLP